MNIQEARAVYADCPSYMANPINLQRGLLHKTQLDLSPLHRHAKKSFIVDGEDVRNYGTHQDGLPEAREMFAEYLGVGYDEIILYERTARSVMYDVLNRAYFQCSPCFEEAWSRAFQSGKIICPVPGYDNHFALCRDIGIPMVPVYMRHDGPDMEEVERLAVSTENIKGIICIPRYHNPTSVTCSPNVVRRLARMKANPDFRIFCDCAYMRHHLTDNPEPLLNILEECKSAGVPDRPLLIFSTSKMTHPSQAVAGIAGSVKNMEWIRGLVRAKMTVPDLMNQLQHVRFLKAAGGIEALLREQAKLIRPKFELVNGVLGRWFGYRGEVFWRMPKGGYSFLVTLSLPCAGRAVQLAKEKGVLLLDPRKMYPYDHDTENRHIRIMPTGIDKKSIEMGMKVVCASIQHALAEKVATL